MTEKPGQTRVPVLLSAEDLAALDEWQFANRFRTRSDAIRELIRRARGQRVVETTE